MTQGTFAVDLRAWCEKAKGNADTVLRGTALELLNRVVLRSPVGNPELWAANKDVVEARKTFNAMAERNNAFIAANPLLQFRYGKLKRQKPLSARTIAKRLPLNSGKGYVGGRFRSNWQTMIGAMPSGTLDSVDPSGQAAIARGAAVIEATTVGPAIFIVNNLPYAHRLEFDSWSKQAPAGMVRVTVAEFNSIVEQQARALTE
jgi:hypothetical protein